MLSNQTGSSSYIAAIVFAIDPICYTWNPITFLHSSPSPRKAALFTTSFLTNLLTCDWSLKYTKNCMTLLQPIKIHISLIPQFVWSPCILLQVNFIINFKIGTLETRGIEIEETHLAHLSLSLCWIGFHAKTARLNFNWNQLYFLYLTRWQ